MLVEVSGPSGTASNTLRPKRLPIHIGSAGERARTRPELLRTRPNEPNRTEPSHDEPGPSPRTVGGILHTLKHRVPTFDSQVTTHECD
jgi:hypothetical protein